MSIDSLTALIRTIPDFPKPGIQFRDVTTLLADGAGFADLVERLASVAWPRDPDLIVGIEARGFILGAALAAALGKGFVPVRKAGKLPGRAVGIDYVLEYGTDRLELHEGQVPPDTRVILVDDLLATGGTALAAAHFPPDALDENESSTEPADDAATEPASATAAVQRSSSGGSSGRS